VGKEEGSGWTRGKGKWAVRGSEGKRPRELWPDGLRAGFGLVSSFLFLFLLLFLFLIQTKFEFKNRFEFKPHSNN
jgi:hypothetical protein